MKWLVLELLHFPIEYFVERRYLLKLNKNFDYKDYTFATFKNSTSGELKYVRVQWNKKFGMDGDITYILHLFFLKVFKN